jgi:ABC-type transport system substrate-binding protein
MRCRICFFLFIFSISLFSNQSKHILRIGIHNFPLTLNPVYVTDEVSQSVINKVFESLYYFDEAGEIRNGLVEKAVLNPDGKIIEIRLRSKRYFSNGKEFDAADVIETFKLLKNRKTQFPYLSTLDFIDSIEQIGRYDIRLILNRKLAIWKNLLTFKILNSDEIKDIDPKNFKNRLLTGTGPYRFQRVREPSMIVLNRNTYDGTDSLFPVVEYSVITSTVMKPLKLLNDEIDICELQPEDWDAYHRISKWKKTFSILRYKKFGYTYLIFNLRRLKLEINLRFIVYNSLINNNFLKRFLKMRGEIVKTPFLLLNDEVDFSSLPAVSLQKPVKLKILANSESKLRKEFILFFKQVLRRENIILEPVFLEYQMFLDSLKKGRFDLAVSGFILDIDYDMKDVLYGGAYFNYSGYKDDRMDALLDLGLKELDSQKRRRFYHRANEIWKAELPLIPLFNLYYYMGISRQVRIPKRVCTLVGSTNDFLINIIDWKTSR